MTSTTELVARLRNGAAAYDGWAIARHLLEAADRITALDRELEEARALNEQNFGRTLVRANHDLRAEVERLKAALNRVRAFVNINGNVASFVGGSFFDLAATCDAALQVEESKG